METEKYETIRYLTRTKLEQVSEKNNIEITASNGEEVIKSAEANDILAIRVSINSPMKIVAISNMSKNDNALIEITE